VGVATVELLVGTAVEEVEAMLELVVLGGATVLLLLGELGIDVLVVVLVVEGGTDVLLVDVGVVEGG